MLTSFDTLSLVVLLLVAYIDVVAWLLDRVVGHGVAQHRRVRVGELLHSGGSLVGDRCLLGGLAKHVTVYHVVIGLVLLHTAAHLCMLLHADVE